MATQTKMILGPFACFAIESEFGLDLCRAAERALCNYVQQLQSRRVPLPPPSFRRGREQAGVEIELSLEPEFKAILLSEASRRSIPLEELIDHAVILYISALEGLRDGPR
jgi:hypothetical protein